MRTKPIVVTTEPVISFTEEIAWINGESVKITDEIKQYKSRISVVDFTNFTADSNNASLGYVNDDIVEQATNENEKHVYLSDDEEDILVINNAAAPKYVAAPRHVAAPAPPKAVIVPVPQQINAAPKFKAVPFAAAAPAKQAVQLNDNAAPEKELTDQEKDERFWNAIAKIGWKNKSDNEFDIDRFIRKHGNAGVNVTELHTRVDLIAAMIADNESYIGLEMEDKQKITYHIVLLGRDWFDNVINAPTLVDFIIHNNEMQDFTIADVEKMFT